MQSNPEKFSKHIEKLSDYSWLLDLAFLADITEKLNILNLDPQGKDKELAQIMGSVKAFKAKLTLWMCQMRSKSLLPGASGDYFCQPIYHKATETTTAIARIIASEVENLELEIDYLKNDIILQAHATDVDFWKLVEKDRLPLLRNWVEATGWLLEETAFTTVYGMLTSELQRLAAERLDLKDVKELNMMAVPSLADFLLASTFLAASAASLSKTLRPFVAGLDVPDIAPDSERLLLVFFKVFTL
ncbi:hypothetical protein J437_LFUL018304 [Ladona fulva]|uniref:Uncharacterized protein n=1 Tax=Ladona fulva TaxID=123851 RepID=A0A8K0KQC1_LADFU|nr:hypothetical protein J437_LFUL018304 [Ladona fulva]